MSHIAVQATKPGQPMFKDMEALQEACNMLKLDIIMKNTYTWYGRSVGDVALPAGMKKEDLGKNAAFVIALNAEMKRKHGVSHQAPYEIGMIADPNNPGCYIPMYDYWQGGYGLSKVVGDHIEAENGKVEMLCPRLKQFYDMCCDRLAAQAAGDSIEFLTLKRAAEKYPEQFPKSQDDETWVSISDTEGRVQTTV